MWLRSWAALLICFGFAVATVALGVRDPADRHWVAYSAFSILGVLFLATNRLIAWRAKRSETARVRLAEGMTFRPRRARLLGLALPLTIVGGLLLWATVGEAWPVRLAAGAMAAIGAGLVLLLLSPRPFSDFVRFEQGFLALGRGAYEIRVPWSEMDSVALDDRAWSIHIQAPRFDRLEVIVPVGGDEAAARARLARTVARNRSWSGADLTFTPWRYGLDPGLTMRAMEQRLTRPSPDEVRVSVRARYRPHGGSDHVRLRLDPATGGEVWRERSRGGQVQQMARPLSLAETRRVLEELQTRRAWERPPPLDSFVMDGLSLSFDIARGDDENGYVLNGVQPDHPVALLFGYLLGLTAFPLEPGPVS